LNLLCFIEGKESKVPAVEWIASVFLRTVTNEVFNLLAAQFGVQALEA
jgi:hypothetical protein